MKTRNYLLVYPKGACTSMVYTWALMGLQYPYFGAYVCTFGYTSTWTLWEIAYLRRLWCSSEPSLPPEMFLDSLVLVPSVSTYEPTSKLLIRGLYRAYIGSLSKGYYKLYIRSVDQAHTAGRLHLHIYRSSSCVRVHMQICMGTYIRTLV